MGNPKIKFSHVYEKLKGVRSAILLAVLEVKLEELPLKFLEYDTDGGKYKLPGRGNYLMLIFQKGHSRENIFTTFRANYPESKRLYYKNLIGKEFEIEITEA